MRRVVKCACPKNYTHYDYKSSPASSNYNFIQKICRWDNAAEKGNRQACQRQTNPKKSAKRTLQNVEIKFSSAYDNHTNQWAEPSRLLALNSSSLTPLVWCVIFKLLLFSVATAAFDDAVDIWDVLMRLLLMLVDSDSSTSLKLLLLSIVTPPLPPKLLVLPPPPPGRWCFLSIVFWISLSQSARGKAKTFFFLFY